MIEISFIKLSTRMFDDEKIKIIETMQDSDTMLIIWIKLLVLAGKVNDSGCIRIFKDIPYTTEQLAAVMTRPVGVIAQAINLFSKFGMVYINGSDMFITNWEKYQQVETLDKIKEQNRLRNVKYREKQKQLAEKNTINNASVTSHVTSHDGTESKRVRKEESKIIEREEQKNALSPNLDSIYDYKNLSYNFTASQLNDVQKKERADLMFSEMKASDMRMQLFEKDFSLTKLQVNIQLAKFIRTSFKTDDIHHSITKMWFYFDNYLKKVVI